MWGSMYWSALSLQCFLHVLAYWCIIWHDVVLLVKYLFWKSSFSLHNLLIVVLLVKYLLWKSSFSQHNLLIDLLWMKGFHNYFNHTLHETWYPPCFHYILADCHIICLIVLLLSFMLLLALYELIFPVDPLHGYSVDETGLVVQLCLSLVKGFAPSLLLVSFLNWLLHGTAKCNLFMLLSHFL